MRGFGLFLGTARRNDPVKLVDPRPIANYGTKDVECGDAGRDGFTVLARAPVPGMRPPVAGTVGPTYRGPDSAFES